ncbi:prepilin peptidase [Lachnoclostridium sp. Marseille-P6806]|uniref:prepilin peptidase n=1 Tax=Lachnoclostridium sp. Marseille-P6806 TaxID=2364793 RepID=UPI00102FA357|nr:prepilin peptidase [Lachnoclostridium sp. Marseille-P6806]
MPIRIAVILAELLLLMLLPDALMKYKKKSDLCGRNKKLAAYLLSAAGLLASSAVVAAMEADLVTFCLYGLILLLSAVTIVVDARCRIIPNLCLFPMLLLSLGILIRNRREPWVNIPYSILSMLFMCAFMLSFTALLHFHNYFGAGDIKFLSVSAFLFTLSARIIGMLGGMVLAMLLYIVPMLLMRRITLKSLIAFGPFIGFGMMAGICWLYVPYPAF